MVANSRLVALARRLLDWGNPRPSGVRGFLRIRAAAYLSWNRRLLLDPWLRYHPAISVLKRMDCSVSRILDAGSGGYGLAYFLRRPVVGVDVQFSRGDMRSFPSPIEPVRASAVALPFRDRAFEAVVSMDMVEHVPASMRGTALEELFRVSGGLLVIGFPFGSASSEHDRRALAEERRSGDAPLWREEHVSNGLPGQEVHDKILELARSSSIHKEADWFGHEGLLGLRVRWRLQRLIGANSRIRGMVLAPLYFVHARGRRRRAYRRVYVIRP